MSWNIWAHGLNVLFIFCLICFFCAFAFFSRENFQNTEMLINVSLYIFINNYSCNKLSYIRSIHTIYPKFSLICSNRSVLSVFYDFIVYDGLGCLGLYKLRWRTHNSVEFQRAALESSFVSHKTLNCTLIVILSLWGIYLISAQFWNGYFDGGSLWL